MALVTCTGCGHQISSRARLCPKCRCSTAGDHQPGSGNPGIKIGTAAGNAPVADAAETGPDKSEVLVQERPQEASQVAPPMAPLLAAPAAAPAAPAAAPPAALQDESLESDQSDQSDQSDTVPQAAEWYYVAASGRSGPVTLASLLKFAADGQIDDQTPVWKAGMPDWIALSRHKEAAQASSPAQSLPIAGKSAPKWCLWALALAPAWGAILQIIATETLLALTRKQLSYYSQMWWIIVVANLAAAALDFVVLKKSGQDVARLDRGMFLLVPVYICLRGRSLNANFIYIGNWAGSLLLSLSVFLYLNSSYARLLTQ